MNIILPYFTTGNFTTTPTDINIHEDRKREKISCYNHIGRNEFSNCEGNHLDLKLNRQKQKNLCG